MSLTQTGSTRRRHGKHLKSIWTTAASWFSNTPEDPGRLAEKPPPKEFLAKRLGELRSRQMKTAVESPDPARSRRLAEHSSFQRFSFQHFSFTQIPLFPRNPHFPALRSVPMALSGASRRKQIPSRKSIARESWKRCRSSRWPNWCGFAMRLLSLRRCESSLVREMPHYFPKVQ